MRSLLKLLEPIQRRLKQMVRVATLIKVDDTGPIQMVQVEGLDGEPMLVPRVQTVGLTSYPLKGAKGALLAVGGKSNSYIVVTMDDGSRRITDLKEGETCLYDADGQIIHLKQQGQIQITGNTKVTVTAPLARFEGDLDVTGEIKDRCDQQNRTMADMRDVYDDHDHQGDSGGTTSQPNQRMGA